MSAKEGGTVSIIEANRRLNAEEARAGRTRLKSGPLQINIDLTGVCNIDPPCVFCTGKNFGHNYKPLDAAYLERHADLMERAERVTECSFGEPLSHPALAGVAQRCTERGQLFSITTNGLLLSGRRAEALARCGPRLGLHVSLNAASTETYFKLTGRDFGQLLQNLRGYVATYREHNAGQAPRLVLTFIVMRVNRHEVPALLGLARELGVGALLAPLHDRPSLPLGDFGYRFVYEDEMLPYAELVDVGREARALAARLGVVCMLQWDAGADSALTGFAEPGAPSPCLIPWRFLQVQEHSQSAFACPYHRLPLGDLSRHSLAEVWNGEAAQELRRSLAAGRIPDFCRDHSAGCPLVMARVQADDWGEVEERVEMGRNDRAHLLSGWHPLERLPDAVRWTSGEAAFRLRAGGRSRLVVEAIAWAPEPVSGFVEVEGRLLGRFRVGPEWQRLDYALPAPLVAIARGRLVIDAPWVPAQAGLGKDTRQLGIAVRGLSAE